MCWLIERVQQAFNNAKNSWHLCILFFIPQKSKTFYKRIKQFYVNRQPFAGSSEKNCIAMLEGFKWNCQISVFQFVNIDPDCKVLVTIFWSFIHSEFDFVLSRILLYQFLLFLKVIGYRTNSVKCNTNERLYILRKIVLFNLKR